MKNSKYPNIHKTYIEPDIEEGFGEFFSIQTKSKDQLSLVGIISTYKDPYTASVVDKTYKINTFVNRPVFFKELKNLKGEKFYLNILSVFDNDNLDIDQIDYLQRRMQQKKERKDQQAITGEEGEKRKKKDQIDYESVYQNLNISLLVNIFDTSTKDTLQESIAELGDPFEQGEPPHVSVTSFTSKYQKLPFDTLDPFNEDIIEYANQRPLQILVLAKPKTGCTSFCKQFSLKVDIVHIEIE